jgi:hypothetical protein
MPSCRALAPSFFFHEEDTRYAVIARLDPKSGLPDFGTY